MENTTVAGLEIYFLLPSVLPEGNVRETHKFSFVIFSYSTEADSVEPVVET
jgi:hypothetical protein